MVELSSVETRYTDEATKRVRSVEKRSLEAFFGQLSARERAQSVSQLPDQKGFKKGSEAHTRAKIRVLIGHITGKSTKTTQLQRDLNALGFAWQTTGARFTKLNLALQDLFEEWGEREADLDISEYYEDFANRLLGALRELTYQDKLTREEVEEYFQFSPFSRSSDVQNILDTCKSMEQVERDKKLSELPDLLDKAWRKINSLSAKVEEFTKREGDRTEAVESIGAASTSALEEAARVEQALQSLRKSFKEFQTYAESSNSDQSQEFERQTDAISSLRTTIESIQEALAAANRSLAKLEEKDVALRGELEELASQVQQLNAPKQNDQTISTGSQQTKDRTIRAKLTDVHVSLGRILHRDVGSQLQTISETSQALSLLVKNLESVGVKNSSAELLASAVLAALIAGQVPVFSGTHGRLIAQVCAMAVSGGNTFSLKIPVGMRSPEDFGDCLREMKSLASIVEDLCCLIIEGINRSAFDAFGEDLVGLLQESRLEPGSAHIPVLMATLTSGPASLPLAICHTTIGPALSTDCLEWRTRTLTKNKAGGGRIPMERWQKLRTTANDHRINSDELESLLQSVLSVPNPMLRQTVHLAHRALATIDKSSPEEFALRHLVLGWILPIGIAQRQEASELKDLLSKNSDRLNASSEYCERIIQIYEAERA